MAKVKSTTKKGFMDGYKTYDPEVEGYGNSSQWKKSFNFRMGYDEAKSILSDENPYSILGIFKNATMSEIKKAYYKMAMKFHPDKNPGIDTTEMMQKINAAYTILISK